MWRCADIECSFVILPGPYLLNQWLTSLKPKSNRSSENAPAIAESLNQCIDSQFHVRIGETTVWSDLVSQNKLNEAGLVVAFQIGEEGFVVAIPASLPLPDWYTEPNDSEDSRLQTLAMEWSMNLFPMDLEATESKTSSVENLKTELEADNPVDWAAAIEILIYNEDPGETASAAEPAEGETSTAEESADAAAEPADDAVTEEETDPAASADETDSEDKSAEKTDEASSESATLEPAARLYLIGPVLNPPFPVADSAEEEPSSAESTDGAAEQFEAPAYTAGESRLSQIPVTVIVRLAEKKIEMSQLLTLSAGTLITFNKSCEDSLDLYVNNQLYCRGEAVKIGEKFGLKIDEIGAENVRESKIV